MSDISNNVWGLPDPNLAPELYADVPAKRALAWVVDALLIFLLTLLILPFTAFTAVFFYPLLWVTVSFFYRVLTISGGSATWGMRLMAVELRNMRGERFGFGEAFLHTLLYSVFFSFLVPQIVSMVLILTTERHQGLHDLILGSAALNSRR
ncbi:RDD family protein [Tropicimonas sp.]|uniref:RDD family protein n=1 Tax=Tropicimonas sp. TaxID=2067044 RepID=UPI003A84865E